MSDPPSRILRTPDARFSSLPDYPFAAHYHFVSARGVDDDRRKIRMHYIDENSSSTKGTVLLLHGQPSWSYIYRNFIPPLVAAGYRVVAPDLIGFGKSDKPSLQTDYSYDRHVGWIRELIEFLSLTDVTLFCQDWGSLIGLNLAGTAGVSQRFTRIAVSNGDLPDGTKEPSAAFRAWQKYALSLSTMNCGRIVSGGTVRGLTAEEIEAYNAPYPDNRYQGGCLAFPRLVPTPENPYPSNTAALKHLAVALLPATKQRNTDFKQFVTWSGADDKIFKGSDVKLQLLVKGSVGQKHAILAATGHFSQEDQPNLLAQNLLRFITFRTPHRSATQIFAKSSL